MKKQDMFELIEYGLKKKDDNFRKKVESILADEKAAFHRANVDFLERLLDTRVTRFLNQDHGYFTDAINENMVKDLLYVKQPVKTLDKLELPDTLRRVVAEIIEEQQQKEKLEEHGLSPRSRILLEGPPGNGKTCLAEALANVLQLPFLVVRQEQLINSYLGKTANNLYKVLSYAVKQPCVLFIDEFDAIGSNRHQSASDTNEFNRVVNSLLTEMDALPSYVIFIVATNRGDALDKALWRRFQISVTLPMPTIEGLTHYYKQYMEEHHLALPMEAASLAEVTMPCSYADAEELMITLHRKMVLHEDSFKLDDELKQWRKIRRKQDA